MAVELAEVLDGKPQPSTVEWKKKIDSIPPGRKGGDPTRKGTSVNWWFRAVAIGAHVGGEWLREAIRVLRIYMATPNDLDLAECYTSHGMYFADNLTAKVAARDEIRRSGQAPDVVEQLTVEIRQVIATLLFLSSHPDDLPLNAVCMAGPRGGSFDPVDPNKPQRPWLGSHEYILLACAGWTDAEIERRVPGGKAGIKGLSGEDPERAITWVHHHVERLRASLQADGAVVFAAYRARGWEGVKEFFKVGTRARFTLVRTEGGVFSTMKTNMNSFKAAQSHVSRDGRKDVVRIPPGGAKKVGLVRAEAEVDFERRVVRVEVEGMGKYATPFPGGKVTERVEIGPEGVFDRMKAEQPPVDPPPPPPPGPVEPPVTPAPQPPKPRLPGWLRNLIDAWKEWWSGR